MASKQKWKVWIDQKAFSKHVLKGDGVKKAVMEIGTQAVNAAGEGYMAKPYTGKYRAGVIVAPETAKAYYDNLRNNTLLKSLRGK